MARAQFHDLRNDYNEQATGYLARRFSDPSGQHYNVVHRRTITEIMRVEVGHSERGLEVAPGPGRLTDVLQLFARRMHAVELSEGMIGELRHNLADGDMPLVLQGDTFHLPFPNDSFDFTASFRFVHLFPVAEQERLLLEIFRVTRPGGYVVIEFNNRHYGGVLSVLREWFLSEDLHETHMSIRGLQQLGVPGELVAVRGVGFPLLLGRVYPRWQGWSERSYCQLGKWPFTRWMAQQLIAVWRKGSRR